MSGGTGYVGRALAAKLTGRSHRVLILARPGSEKRVAPGAEMVPGDALDESTFARAIPEGATFVQLVGTPHPAPWKEAQFRAVDRKSLNASVAAAVEAEVRHFVYVSVAQPAPVMRAYLTVRAECEAILKQSGLVSTIVRPWYVLGPGHWWPVVLKPFYALLEALPSTRASALRLGLVSLDQMAQAMLYAIENPPVETQVIDVPEIRRLSAYSR